MMPRRTERLRPASRLRSLAHVQCLVLHSWAPTSVREVLFRDVYRGSIAWNRTRKRNKWGLQRQTARPAGEWLTIPAETLRIVPDDLWTAAHARLDAARGIYLRANKGRAVGRPALGSPSKYLLTNLALCGYCGGPLKGSLS